MVSYLYKHNKIINLFVSLLLVRKWKASKSTLRVFKNHNEPYEINSTKNNNYFSKLIFI